MNPCDTARAHHPGAVNGYSSARPPLGKIRAKPTWTGSPASPVNLPLPARRLFPIITISTRVVARAQQGPARLACSPAPRRRETGARGLAFREPTSNTPRAGLRPRATAASRTHTDPVCMIDRFFNALRSLIERPLVVWLALLSLLAFSWDRWLADLPDPFVASKPYGACLFAITMLAIGSLLPRDEVVQLARRWRAIVSGTAIQYTSMPLLAYAFGRLFGLHGPWMVGMIMVGCVPGAMASNVLTLAARGNVSYSLSLTTSATLLSPVFVPAVLGIALAGTAEYPLGEIAIKVALTSANLLWMVVLPVIAGYCLSRLWWVWEAAAKHLGAIIANLTILWIIATVVAANRTQLAVLDPGPVLALLAVNLSGYSVGAVGGHALGLPSPMRRALTLEIGMQNAGLGTILVGIISPDPAAAIAPAIYTFGCMLTGTVLARAWAEWDRRHAICYRGRTSGRNRPATREG
ncbi:MAG TPA: bile acid:sodium symporter family protein [Planctomycetaceae bacterium]|nr:bile acid:sodium symporter family protein [Planctomycetaceae bacterium]